jgi:hypothetical protein
MVSVVQNRSLSEFFTGCKDYPDLRLVNIENLVLLASLCMIYDCRFQIEAACIPYGEVLSS